MRSEVFFFLSYMSIGRLTVGIFNYRFDELLSSLLDLREDSGPSQKSDPFQFQLLQLGCMYSSRILTFSQIPVPSKSIISHANQISYSAVCLLASASFGHTGSCRRFAVANCVNNLESRAIVAGIVVLFSGVLVVQLSKKKRKPNSGHALLSRRRTSRYLGWPTHRSWIDMLIIINPVGRA